MNKRGKAAANLKKHQVSFEKAKSIFFEEFGVQFFDEDPSADEERFPMLGMSPGSKLLIVCHREREQGAVIRIISARKNPYASRLKKPATMRLSEDVVEYFKAMVDEADVPYQSLINLYLRDCLANSRKVQIKWP